MMGKVFGYGLAENIEDGYEYLMDHFLPDDKLFVFGFSRGAYAARSLCGMLHAVGLLTRGNEAQIPGYTVAGKTGTAQVATPHGYSTTDYTASFVGMYATLFTARVRSPLISVIALSG